MQASLGLRARQVGPPTLHHPSIYLCSLQMIGGSAEDTCCKLQFTRDAQLYSKGTNDHVCTGLSGATGQTGGTGANGLTGQTGKGLFGLTYDFAFFDTHTPYLYNKMSTLYAVRVPPLDNSLINIACRPKWRHRQRGKHRPLRFNRPDRWSLWLANAVYLALAGPSPLAKSSIKLCTF